jgi:hypothetical protein
LTLFVVWVELIPLCFGLLYQQSEWCLSIWVACQSGASVFWAACLGIFSSVLINQAWFSDLCMLTTTVGWWKQFLYVNKPRWDSGGPLRGLSHSRREWFWQQCPTHGCEQAVCFLTDFFLVSKPSQIYQSLSLSVACLVAVFSVSMVCVMAYFVLTSTILPSRNTDSVKYCI